MIVFIIMLPSYLFDGVVLTYGIYTIYQLPKPFREDQYE